MKWINEMNDWLIVGGEDARVGGLLPGLRADGRQQQLCAHLRPAVSPRHLRRSRQVRMWTRLRRTHLHHRLLLLPLSSFTFYNCFIVQSYPALVIIIHCHARFLSLSGPGFKCIYRIYRPWWWWFKLIININIWLLICNIYYRKMFNRYNLYHQGL